MSLKVIIFSIIVGFFILVAYVYLSIGYGAMAAISQIMPEQSLETWSPKQSLETMSVIDPVLALNKVSPVYTPHPEFSDMRNSIVKPNVPMPVPTSVTV